MTTHQVHPAFTKHPAPRARQEIAIAVWFLTSMTIILGFASHFINVDHYFGTYGVSIGTNNNYCSIEDKLPVFTCESAR